MFAGCKSLSKSWQPSKRQLGSFQAALKTPNEDTISGLLTNISAHNQVKALSKGGQLEFLSSFRSEASYRNIYIDIYVYICINQSKLLPRASLLLAFGRGYQYLYWTCAFSKGGPPLKEAAGLMDAAEIFSWYNK